MINKMNLNHDSNILKDSQYYILLKGFEPMNRIFNIYREHHDIYHQYEEILPKPFHNKKYSDNKLIIFEIDGRNIFGAYKSFILEKKDDKGFVFSLTNNKVYFTDCNNYSSVKKNWDLEVVNYFYIKKK